jgi:hypothetical protein
MRHFLLIAGILVVAVGIGTPTEAQNYPWCAEYGGTPDGPTNCGFVSFAQCLATVSGVGGFCVKNNTYVPPPGPHAPTRAQKQQQH